MLQPAILEGKFERLVLFHVDVPWMSQQWRQTSIIEDCSARSFEQASSVEEILRTSYRGGS